MDDTYQVAGFDGLSSSMRWISSSSPSSYPSYLAQRYLIRNDRLEKYAMLTVRLQPPNIQPSILSGMPFTHTIRRCDSTLLTRTDRITRPRHCNNNMSNKTNCSQNRRGTRLSIFMSPPFL
jgi:hypothetical protein